jgi:hypothetical protein
VVSTTKSSEGLLPILPDRTPAESSIPWTRKWVKLHCPLVEVVDRILRNFWSLGGGKRNKGRSERGRVEGWNGGFVVGKRGLAVLNSYHQFQSFNDPHRIPLRGEWSEGCYSPKPLDDQQSVPAYSVLLSLPPFLVPYLYLHFHRVRRYQPQWG